MKGTRGLLAMIGWALLLSASNAFPLDDSGKTLGISSVDLEEIPLLPEQRVIPAAAVQETKNLAEFFSLLQQDRNKKSLSIVGKDKKYIYLLVADRDSFPLSFEREEEEEAGVVEEGRRKKRNVLKKVGEALDLIGPTGIRLIAVPISLFNYLGYLPMRLPGVPYHIDPGSPDYVKYDIVNHFYSGERR